MSELRRDPLNERWVIIAENRAERPNEFTRPAVEQRSLEQRPRDCVFCPGNEHQTPEALLVRRPANWKGDPAAWRIRVIANRYPAVEQTASGVVREGPLHWSAGGFGVHEVIVDTAQHVTSITHSSEAEVAELFEVYRERMLAGAKLAGDCRRDGVQERGARRRGVDRARTFAVARDGDPATRSGGRMASGRGPFRAARRLRLLPVDGRSDEHRRAVGRTDRVGRGVLPVCRAVSL